MSDLITAAINQATLIITEAMLAAGDVMPRELDAEVESHIRCVGLGVCKAFIEARSVTLIEEGKAKGLVTQRRPKVTFYTVFGPIFVESPYMWCAVDQFGWRPLSAEFGVADRARSRRLERALVDFGSERSFAKAAIGFEEHYGWELGRTTIRSATRMEAARAERFVDSLFAEAARLYEIPLATRPGRDHLVAELDGCLIRTGKLMTARQALRDGVPPHQLVRQESWREVRTAFARGLDEVDATYVCRIGSYDEVTEQMFGAACRHGLTERTTVIAPSDGAFGLREALQERFPSLQFVLDYSHLKGHVYDTADEMKLSAGIRERWTETVLDDIWAGNVADVIQRLTESYHGSGNQRLRRLIEDLERFADSVGYQESVDRGWPIGSGEVESAHRYIPQARLKIPGACWRVESINPMLALRLLKANGWWKQYWLEDKDRLAAA